MLTGCSKCCPSGALQFGDLLVLEKLKRAAMFFTATRKQKLFIYDPLECFRFLQHFNILSAPPPAPFNVVVNWNPLIWTTTFINNIRVRKKEKSVYFHIPSLSECKLEWHKLLLRTWPELITVMDAAIIVFFLAILYTRPTFRNLYQIDTQCWYHYTPESNLSLPETFVADHLCLQNVIPPLLCAISSLDPYFIPQVSLYNKYLNKIN